MNRLLKYLLILSITFSSCQDILYDEDISYKVLDTQQEKVDVLNGVYTLINNVHDNNYLYTCCRADDINEYSKSSFKDCKGSIADPYNFNEIIDAIYKKLFTAVVTCNSLIEQTSGTDDPAILGEAYFLRAYCFFKLARLYGTPPLVSDTEIDFTIEKPTFKQVYEFIESDLELAINLLPETIENARIPFETITKNGAKALLAEVYLSMAGYPVNDTEKYTKAAKLSGEVIESDEYYLLEDLADLWKENNKHHHENIFGIFFSNQDIPRDMWSQEIPPEYNLINTVSISTSSSGWYNSRGIRVGSDYRRKITSDLTPDFQFYQNFPDNYRKHTSFTMGQYKTIRFEELDGSISEVLTFIEADPFIDPCDYINKVSILKFIDKSTVDFSNEFPSKVTLYLLRYAHTLLTFAEAKARIGEIDASAYNAVNQIRRRANKADIYTESKFDLSTTLTQDQFIDSVLWERAWELCFEPDGRWFDIIRLDLKDNLNEYTADTDIEQKFQNEYITEDWYFFKIPQHDIYLNPNIE